MADWSAQASKDLASFKKQSSCSEEELGALRKSVSSWADMIGKFNRKTFKIRNYSVAATAENHEVLGLVMDM